MTTIFKLPPEATRLPDPYADEVAGVRGMAATLQGALDWPAVIRQATPWVEQVRAKPAPFWAMESLLREYPITSAEGLALMRLAEALLRVPDAPTAIALTADQLGRAQFDAASDGPHKMLASLSASAIALSKKFLPEAESEGGLLTRLGAQTVVAATVRAIQLLGRQFVLGRNIREAMAEAAAARRVQPQLSYSYDMLGEGARTEEDAAGYQISYLAAIDAISGGVRAASPHSADGISIKLSALFSRYEVLHRERVYAELLPRIWQLIEKAAQANINLTIDAEEVDRLELSLDVLESLAERIAAHYPQWGGFGLAVQAYQTRALAVVQEVAAIARRHGLKFMVRLVKGAYWDAEIKRAQELGLAGYPVFTHKPHTDVAYLACARALIANADVIYPQFASHNAGTVAAILQMARSAGGSGIAFEMQRLHGMSEGLHREVLRDPSIACRIYAPVGEHRDLLAYLVRRLLENGANSSFVHQLTDGHVPIPELLASPLPQVQEVPALPMPAKLYRAASGQGRANSSGVDLTALEQRQPLQQALADCQVLPVPLASTAEVEAAMARLQTGFAGWSATPVASRAAVLRRAATALEAALPEFSALLVKEAYKTLGDCVAEVREAVDFLRYYADQAEEDAAQMLGRGVFVCISPWNFPLAIFAGQVAAALVAGNTVAAKPAEQTPFVALKMVELLYAAGLPADALLLLHGPGETVGAHLVAAAQTAGVCFTGSTQVAQIINRTLAAKPGAVVPLIAETGGINAMVVDSTALPEQVVDAVVQSAFRSAGQRCSALRLLCVQDEIADGVLTMLRGAMLELRVGDPAELATDVGPVIDDEAFENIQTQVERLKRDARLIGESPLQGSQPRLAQPVAFEIASVSELRQEIFGPVLHVLRFRGDVSEVIEQINTLGFGLTLGIQTRIDSRALRLAQQARIGNVYVNRNIIGAVVGVQPFGGEGMSGTGPKAGGPNYLQRFVALPTPQIQSAVGTASGDGDAVADLSEQLSAQQRWSEQPLAARAAIVRAAALARGQVLSLDPLSVRAGCSLAERELPGPTGETNTLRTHGRGVLLGLAGQADDAAQMQAWGAALMAGNALTVLADGPARAVAQRIAEVLHHAGLPKGLLRFGALAQEGSLLQSTALAGVVLAWPDAASEHRVQQALAQRRGALLPLITAEQAMAPSQLYRFAAEQTLTINTAAAGGNAALLSGME